MRYYDDFRKLIIYRMSVGKLKQRLRMKKRGAILWRLIKDSDWIIFLREAHKLAQILSGIRANWMGRRILVSHNNLIAHFPSVTKLKLITQN